MQVSGENPNSFSYIINPFARANYMHARALEVTDNDEAFSLISGVALDVGISYLRRFRLLTNPNGLNFNWLRGEGGGINGFSISSRRLWSKT